MPKQRENVSFHFNYFSLKKIFNGYDHITVKLVLLFFAYQPQTHTFEVSFFFLKVHIKAQEKTFTALFLHIRIL